MKKKTLIKLFFVLISVLNSQAVSDIPITLTDNRPASVNNASTPHFREIFNQAGSSCGNAAGIGYVFTYEINAARNLSAVSSTNQYAYLHAFHFLNEGSGDTGRPEMCKDAWRIAMENGIPSVSVYGGFEIGFPTKWLSGYDNYYKGMKNRVKTYDSITLNSVSALDSLRQWLSDHGNGSSKGGLGIVTPFAHGQKTTTIKSGSGTGQTIITSFGTSGTVAHAYTIVGYNDNVRYDFNGDGKYTNGNNISEWETGAVIIANSWGKSSFDQGFAFVPYRLLALPPESGGLLNSNRFYFCSLNEPYTVRAALKATIVHPSRNQIALSVGVSSNAQNTVPEKKRSFKKQFTYAGGNFPMCGNKASDTIEIGLDISDLIDSIDATKDCRVFLVIDSKSSSGKVISLSLMDYTTGALIETASEQKDILIENGTTNISVLKSFNLESRKVFKRYNRDKINAEYTNSALQIYSLIPGSKQIVVSDLQGKIYLSSVIENKRFVNIPKKLNSGLYIVTIRNRSGIDLLQEKVIVP